MVGLIDLERGLYDLPGRPCQQTIRACQLDALPASRSNQLLSDRGEIIHRRNQLARVRVNPDTLVKFLVRR